MGFFADNYDSSSELKEDLKYGYYDMEVATKFSNIQSSANNKLYFTISNAQRTTDSNNLEMYWFTVGDSNNVKIYPDSYEDVIYAERSDIKKMMPWYEVYGSNDTSITLQSARNLYNQYGKNSSYFNSTWVNNLWKQIAGTDFKFLKSNVKSYSYLRNHSSWNVSVTGDLYDLVDTKTDVSVEYTKYNKRNGDYPYAGLTTSGSVSSVFQISGDGVNYINLTGAVNAKTFTFNMISHAFNIAGKNYAMPDSLKDKNTWYVRRVTTATGALSSYVNKVSPAIKIRPSLSLDGLDVYYNGPAVTEGNYLDTSYVKVIAHYSTGDQVYAGNGSYISYTNTRIMNVGKNNYVYYKYVDPKLKEVREGWFQVQGYERKPVSMTAVYEGPDVVIGRSYNPANLRVYVTYNNGDSAVFNANSSATVGTLNKTSYYSLGDVDCNGAVNSADLGALENAIKAGDPFINDMQAFTQADINGDGKIDENDVSLLKSRIEGKITKIGSNTFFATYSGLMDPENLDKPLFATFYVEGINKSPYKISIIKDPDKVSYIDGEDFEPKGMILAITFDNDEVSYIEFNGTENTTGLKIGDDDHPSKAMPAGQTILPIKYTENGKSVSTNLRLSVRNRILTSIKITTPADTLTYYAGENFNPAGMVVTAYYDEDNEDKKRIQEAILDSFEYTLSDNRKLKNGQDYVVIESDGNKNIDPDLTKMNGFIRIAKTDILEGPGLEKGTSGTWTYAKGSKEYQVSGQIVGNALVRVSYTERNKTRYDYQPISVYAKRLSALSVQSSPFTSEYMTGQDFNSAGLILLASYTDGTRDYIYAKSADRNGYEITNGLSLSTDRTTVTAKYTENEITKDVSVPISVIDPEIDGIEASYVGSSVYVGNNFDLKDLIIIVSYTNGNKESFRANELNGGGSYKAKVVKPDDDGTIDSGTVQDISITEKGANRFAAIYSGHSALFSVNGIAAPDRLDFSNSVAENKRDYSTWTEIFKAIKIKSVEDFITGRAGEFENSDAEENHLVPKSSTTDTRTSLIQDEGTMQAVAGDLRNPMLNFLRQGTWIQPDNTIYVEYKGRTNGYLFPEVNSALFTKDNSYYNKYYQSRSALNSLNNTDGWSDWASNGESIGTVLSDRAAYNYGGTGGDNSAVQMKLDRVKFRLRDVPSGSNAYILVESESVDGVVSSHTYTAADDTEDIIYDPARIKVTLGGTITVRNNSGGTDTVNFADEYKAYFRATTDDTTIWAKGGEWTGYSGVPIQNFELRIMQKDAWFDEGSASNRPVITENPRNVTVIVGFGTTFTVKAVGNDLSYQWYKNGEAIPGATSNTYATGDLTKEDDGNTYYCMVIGESASTKSAVALVNVKDEYPVLTENITNIEGELGDSISLSVGAYCRVLSDLKFSWEMTDSTGEYRPFVPLDVNEGDGSSTIGFTLTSEMHGKRIRCKISNSEGSIYSNAAQINCKMPPEMELNFISDHLVVSSTATTITAVTKTTASGGIRSYVWSINGTIDGDATTEKLSFIPSKEGKYVISCTATDDVGSATKEVTIYVGKAPTVEISHRDFDRLERLESDKLVYLHIRYHYLWTIITASELSDGVKISWYKDGKLLEHDGTDVIIGSEGGVLILKEGTSREQFTITCRVSDCFGEAAKIIAIS